MNNKGWIRIVEAVIAILMILGFVLVAMSKDFEKTDISEAVYEKQRFILEVIANNESLREDIIGSGNFANTNNYISKNIPSTWDFVINICGVNMVCNGGTPQDKEVYASETIISSTLGSFPGKSQKLMFFIWKK